MGRLLALLWLCVAVLTMGQSAAAAPVASGARLGEHPQHTRFVLELSETVDYRLFSLADPNRIVLEMPEIDWRLSRKAGISGAGLVKSYKYGPFGNHKSRVVLDLSSPAKVESHFIIPPEGKTPARLVLDIVPASDAEFRATAGWPEDAKPSDPVAAAPDLPPPTTKTIDSHDGKFVIALDAGHGGVDPGASGVSGTHEKDVTLEIVKALKDELEKRGHFTVVLTRADDTYLTLKDRVRVARAAKADLFISIHADSVSGEDVHGVSIYTLSETASDKEAEDLAQEENASDIISGVDLSGDHDDVTDILIDLAQRETKNRSVTFAQMVLGEVGKQTALLPESHRFAGFRVLKAPDVPSVLIETGFLSNETDEAALTSPKWRKSIARSVASAVDAYYQRMSSIAQGGSGPSTAR